jgi:2-phospho-L-lactate/phosphoenolpyruvate guanylyltransferase
MTAVTIDALLPVKGFVRAKERLANLLTSEERSRLARAMFSDVLAALLQTAAVERVWVVSPDREALSIAVAAGAREINEPSGSGGLNAALEAGRTQILSCHGAAEGLLVVPTDVPAADPASFTQFLEGAGREPMVRLCPSADGGTNALLLRPASAIAFAFGRDSAAAHRRLATAAGARFEVRRVAALATDVDRPEDLTVIFGDRYGPATTDLVKRLGIDRRLDNQLA